MVEHGDEKPFEGEITTIEEEYEVLRALRTRLGHLQEEY